MCPSNKLYCVVCFTLLIQQSLNCLKIRDVIHSLLPEKSWKTWNKKVCWKFRMYIVLVNVFARLTLKRMTLGLSSCGRFSHNWPVYPVLSAGPWKSTAHCHRPPACWGTRPKFPVLPQKSQRSPPNSCWSAESVPDNKRENEKAPILFVFLHLKKKILHLLTNRFVP